ncbi:MAG: CPBP family glutamic-type intramembrane protease, partial [Eubacteriales bacterium]|nr:CPBP family glutamic-type intramembrane protease [Eubacteriales bacterium]
QQLVNEEENGWKPNAFCGIVTLGSIEPPMNRIVKVLMSTMTVAAIASLFGRQWYILALCAGIAGVITSCLFGNVTLQVCGLTPAEAIAGLSEKKNRMIALLPLVFISAEVWIGIHFFEDYIYQALSVLNRQLIFSGSATLALYILLLTVVEEVPWRCFYQLNIGRNFPAAFALILPAAGMTLLALPLYHNGASILCLLGFFARRVAWGYLYVESGSMIIVILSHWLATLLYLILLVGV